MTTQDNHVAALREALNQLAGRWEDECQGVSTDWHGGLFTAAKELRAILSQPPAPEQASGDGDFSFPIRLTCSACLFHEAQDDCEVCGGEIDYTETAIVPQEVIRAIRATTPTAEPGGEAVTKGWKLVPVEPTKEWAEALLKAGYYAAYTTRSVSLRKCSELISLVLSASPAAPEDGPLPNEPKPCLMCDPSVGVFCDEHAAPVAAKPENRPSRQWYEQRLSETKDDEFVVPAKPEQQAQAGEPEVVAWCELTLGGKSIAHFDGKPMVMCGPVGNEHHPVALITLQSHREAIAAYARRNVVITQMLEREQEAIAKKDAALQACVEALKHLAHNARASGAEMGLAFAVADDAIAHANEVLGIKEGGV